MQKHKIENNLSRLYVVDVGIKYFKKDDVPYLINTTTECFMDFTANIVTTKGMFTVYFT